jgi:hypothetical protein
MKASRQAWLFCMLLFYTALLMWNIFTKLLSVFFPSHMYVAKVLLMNTLYSIENIPVMQVSTFAQVTLPDLVTESICIIPYLLECKTRFFPEI